MKLLSSPGYPFSFGHIELRPLRTFSSRDPWDHLQAEPIEEEQHGDIADPRSTGRLINQYYELSQLQPEILALLGPPTPKKNWLPVTIA